MGASSPTRNSERNTRANAVQPTLQAVGDLTAQLDEALRLPPPTSPTKNNRRLLAVRQGQDEDRTSVVHGDKQKPAPSNGHSKENTAPRGYETTQKALDPSRGLTAEQTEKLQKPEVKRMATVSQLFFYDYYFDLLSYLHNRSKRTQTFKDTFRTKEPLEYQRAWKQYAGRERAALRKRRTKLRTNDFHVLAQVGQGGYGQVYLTHKNDTREICALKVMNKRQLFKMDEVRHVLTERDILTAAKSPWLVKLLYAFQDDESIYLAMEYVPGGDFRTLLNNTGILASPHARFYISEMFCAVDALHSLGYIHRDLKPENFLIDSTGHIKLTDFGLSSGVLSPRKIESMKNKLDQVKDMKVTVRSTTERRAMYKSLREREPNFAKSVVGSPDYMAPEVLKGKEYDFTVDYWSLGCMLFESYTGYPPFAGATTDETWSNLRHWREVFRRPRFEEAQYNLSDRTWDFISQLIAAADRRMSSFASVQKHPYFSEIRDWTTIRDRNAPFVPQLDSEYDVGYFDDFSSEADMAKYKEVYAKQAQVEKLQDKANPIKKGAFVGFTFKHQKGTELNTSPKKKADGNFGTMF